MTSQLMHVLRMHCLGKHDTRFTWNLQIIAELHARAKRARGRSPIAKVIYPSQKIW